MSTSFSASTKKWSDNAKRNTTLVMRQSVGFLVSDLLGAGRSGGAQGPGIIPVDTQNLRNSLMATTAAVPVTRVFADDERLPSPLGEIEAIITGWNPKTQRHLYIGWQAAYARRMNYGFTGADSLGRNYNQAGYFFLEYHAAKWQEYVDRAAALYKDS